MARIARVVAVGMPHHVTQRGNGRRDAFFTDQDRAVYLRTLAEYSGRYELKLLGYCLMRNHVHLIAAPEKPDSMARALGRTHADYARWLHVKHGSNGHLWQSRYFSCPLDAGYLWQALRYVEMNPVRAGLVERAWNWRWSSAQAHVREQAYVAWLEMAPWSEEYTAARWRAVLESSVGDEALTQRLREATLTGRPFGSPAFSEQLERELGRPMLAQGRGRKARAKPVGVAPGIGD